jgi:light-regulated signal transduction histidine kinase (bacteriophytochrome)
LNQTLEHRVAARTPELAAANLDLEAFSYSVSHDLRAPLRAIDGFAQILSEDYAAPMSSETYDYLLRIQQSTRHMAQLVDDLLNFARLGRNALRLFVSWP